MTPWVPIIRKVENGVDVSAEVINPILKGYTDRTQHLYEKFDSILDKSVIIAFDQKVVGASVAKYSVVFYDPSLSIPGLELTKTGFETATTGSLFKSSNSSFIFGIVATDVPGSGDRKANVYLQGLIQLPGTGFVTQMLDTSYPSFKGGPLFLSSNVRGKLTPEPGGLAVFVGYAKSLDEFYLNPSYESVNEFFFNFRFNVLDRPAGRPEFDGSIWTVQSPDNARLGWIPASGVTGIPTGDFTGSLFFYNIPSDANIDADSTLSSKEKADAKALRKTLPPHPGQFNFLTVNGVMQLVKEAAGDTGIYFINDYGIWWYDNTSGKAPWSQDINDVRNFIVNTSNDRITIRKGGEDVAHNYSAGQLLKFKQGSGGTFPTATPTFSQNTLYQVKEVISTTQFTLCPVGDTGTLIDFSNAGVEPNYVYFTPHAWDQHKGTDSLRPKMVLQFVKINPDYKSAVVTSLKPINNADNNSSGVIKFVNSTDANVEAKSGDLDVKFNLPVLAEDESTITGKAVKSIKYDEKLGKLVTDVSPVVTSISGLGAAKVSSNADGSHTITVNDSSLSNMVTSIEVEQSRLEFINLHSFLRIDYTNLPAGFIGKFILPPTVPNLNLRFKLLIAGRSNVSGSRTRVKLKFDYAVSKPNALLTTATTGTTTFYHTLPSNYVKDTCLLIEPVQLTIPAAQLVPNGMVNFRLHRVKEVAEEALEYNQPFCIVGTFWTIS
jgi:hypothetical protein